MQKNLRERADSLKISHAAIAEWAGLTARAFCHYIPGQQEPGLAALLRISKAVGVSPNEFLGVSESAAIEEQRELRNERIQAACRPLSLEDLETVDAVVQTLAQQLTKKRVVRE